MKHIKNMSIRTKQLLAIMLTSGVALVMACSLFLVFEVFAFRLELANNITVLAEAVGSNCAAAIDFNDSRAAEETLAALKANDNIVAAAIYTGDKEIFATYLGDTVDGFDFPKTSAAVQNNNGFVGNLFNLFHPVVQQGTEIGKIYVASDLNALTERLVTYVKSVVMVFVVSLLVVYLLSNRVQRLVSDPILHLAAVARNVAQKKDYTVRAVKRSDDELGQLVDGFNEMLTRIQKRDNELSEARDNLEKRVVERTRELETIHKRLLEASHQAGMAEIATNVLHNVGNVLNSLNVSTALVFDSLKNSKVENLSKVVSLLETHRDDLGDFLTNHPKGKQVLVYLKGFAERLLEERNETLTEISSLKGYIEHINDIVSIQQSYAGVSGVGEVVEIRNLIEDSLRMNDGALTRHGIQLIRLYQEVPLVNVEKHKVLQILINLIRNAKHACEESEKEEKLLTVGTSRKSGFTCITVADNGVGILPENMTRIFNHGFTTRASGHGFGLHSGALAAMEMGGELSAHSDGPGHGATFILKLPNSNNLKSNSQKAPFIEDHSRLSGRQAIRRAESLVTNENPTRET